MHFEARSTKAHRRTLLHLLYVCLHQEKDPMYQMKCGKVRKHNFGLVLGSLKRNTEKFEYLL